MLAVRRLAGRPGAGPRPRRTSSRSSAQRHLEQVHRRRADEPGDERVRRPLVQRPRRVALLQPPVLEHGDAVPERHRLGLVVGDVDRRRRRAATAARRCRRASARAASRRGSRAARPSGRRCGSRTIARPIATRWRWPPESCPGLRSQVLASARAAPRPRARAARARPSSRCAILSGKPMFAATVRYG